jgi:hypothetical protein
MEKPQSSPMAGFAGQGNAHHFVAHAETTHRWQHVTTLDGKSPPCRRTPRPYAALRSPRLVVSILLLVNHAGFDSKRKTLQASFP